MTENQIDHDRLFKELLENFFAEFMELFFPEAARSIDLRQIRFLQQEIFTDVTAGDRHEVDILVETRLKGQPGLILVHIEPQSYVQKNFNERMFVYFSRLYEKYRRKILPVAVFGYDRVRDEPDSFGIVFPFLDVLNFRFYKLELKKLDWREYIHSNNPVAAALLSKMGFRPEERVRVKLEFLRMLARMKVDPARMELLAAFFEAYLKLNREEEEQLYRELGKMDKKEVDAIMQITTSWHEKGRAEGLAEGRAEGKIKAKQEVICRYLARRFGADSAAIQEKVPQLTDMDALDRVLDRLFAAGSLEEARNIIWEELSRFVQ